MRKRKSPQKYTFDSLLEIMARLRGPSGCLWDKEQTHQSIKQHLIEEAYEVVDAIDRKDFAHLKEELGDLLLQVVFHAQIASDEGKFDIGDILEDITTKLVRRHPHIFGDVKVSSSREVVENWESIKRGESGRSLLAGIPRSLPALFHALKLQEKAARVGFDWEEKEPIFEKLTEEIAELEEACREEGREKGEIGDILFTVVNLARRLGIDPEDALRAVNVKFRRRFEFMEKRAKEEGRGLESMSLEEKDRLWEEAKSLETSEEARRSYDEDREGSGQGDSGFSR
ncbi:MAG: nucleoside triphosphate pyrophosphohydrolase [Actinomycetota bacterium]|nr:nucleoside triphosphate pyrophosphohydrolase [Actinomycetota bacterium]